MAFEEVLSEVSSFDGHQVAQWCKSPREHAEVAAADGWSVYIVVV